jgi:hypothetical protein
MGHHQPTPRGHRAKKARRCPQCNRRLRRAAKRCAFCTFTVADETARKQTAAERAAANRADRAAKNKARLEALAWFVQDATDRLDALHDEAIELDLESTIGQDKEAAPPA